MFLGIVTAAVVPDTRGEVSWLAPMKRGRERTEILLRPRPISTLLPRDLLDLEPPRLRRIEVLAPPITAARHIRQHGPRIVRPEAHVAAPPVELHLRTGVDFECLRSELRVVVAGGAA